MRKKLTILCIAAILIPWLSPSTASAQRCLSILPDTSVVTTGAATVRIKALDLRDIDNVKREIVETETYETPFVPKTTALMQNFPNPFNPTTTIAFDVAEAGNVTIRIYDVSGRLVANLLDAHREVGRHQVEWNGKNVSGALVPSGMYFYRMRTAGFEVTKKMLLVR